MIASLAFGALAAPASANLTAVLITPDIKANGQGELIANGIPDGTASYWWKECPPGGGACVQANAVPDSLDRVFDAGNAAPGTVFVVTATDGVSTFSQRSPTYLGPVHSTAPPSLNGNLETNALVDPVAGRWSGGWGDEVDSLQLQICHTDAAVGCVSIADSDYAKNCPGAGAVLYPSFAGMYLRVLDRRHGPGEGILLGAYFGGNVTPLAPGPAVSASLVGSIRQGPGPLAGTCTPPPTVVPNVVGLSGRAAPIVDASSRYRPGRVSADGVQQMSLDSGWKSKRVTAQSPSGGTAYGNLLVSFERGPAWRSLDGTAIASPTITVGHDDRTLSFLVHVPVCGALDHVNVKFTPTLDSHVGVTNWRRGRVAVAPVVSWIVCHHPPSARGSLMWVRLLLPHSVHGRPVVGVKLSPYVAPDTERIGL